MSERPKICLVEDDPIMGESLRDRFLLEGFSIDWFELGSTALDALRNQRYDAIVSDIRLPDMSGEELFYELLSEQRVMPPLIFITGYGSIDKAVLLLKLGAADYITKPFDIDELLAKIEALTALNAGATASSAEPRLGVSLPMRRIEATLAQVAASKATLVITGESGVGKEYVARLLHELDDPERPFVAFNCAALTESLLEAELFGYEKGAFTGALSKHRGLFEQAQSGTLLLDEVGEMPLNMQAKLLRTIQEKRIRRLGAERDTEISVRLVCATNRDLRAMVDAGQFREDLYYRINVIHLHIPPLRERREDILWFARNFLDDHLAEHPEQTREIDSSAEFALLEYDWPGNLRELRHCIERACVLSPQPRLTATLLLDPIAGAIANDEFAEPADERLHKHISHFERDFIMRILDKHEWHVIETAEALGISRKNLWEKMKKLEIKAEAT